MTRPVRREPGRYDAAYMERNAIGYLREYALNAGDFGSTVSELRAVASRRLYWAGILETYTEPQIVPNDQGSRNEIWAHHSSTLSGIGEYLVASQKELSRIPFEFNFFSLWSILDIFPTSWLVEASAAQNVRRESPSPHLVTNFMSLFQLEFPLDASARQYLQDRIREGTEEAPIQIALPAQILEVPVQVDHSDTEAEQDVVFDEDGFPAELPMDFKGGAELPSIVYRGPEPKAHPSKPDTPCPEGYEDVEDLEGVWHRRPKWVDPADAVEAEDFDFGGLPDEDAGSADLIDDFDFGADENPVLTPEEDDDGWKI